MNSPRDSHPVLTCAEAGEWERRLLQGNESAEWRAMTAAGRAVASAIATDFREIGGLPADARVVVLAGKGHNAGDALIAVRLLREMSPRLRVDVAFVLGERGLRPLVRRAWRDLVGEGGAAVTTLRSVEGAKATGRIDLLIDGIFGFSYRPPLPDVAVNWLQWANRADVRLRAAVDLPSGWDEAASFRADFTYATGIVKAPLLSARSAGRLRYLDLGFFAETDDANAQDRVLRPEILDGLRRLRPAQSDKRSYGHVMLVGGSRIYPGAIMLAAQSALHSGVGLVTAAVPETLAPAYAAAVPEVMWVGCPETEEGGLALEAHGLIRARGERATAWMLGPGLGRERETMALVESLVGTATVPVVLDADALQPAIVEAGAAPRVLTPHAGEFKRIAGEDAPGLRDFARSDRVTVLKGPVTQVCAGGTIWHAFGGGPVLARGGSGDVLAGLTGGLLAHTPKDAVGAAGRAVVWHGLAADHEARERGQVAVRTLDLVKALGPALRG